MMINKVDDDKVSVCGLNLSVGALIKQEALEIQEQYKKEVKLCPVDDKTTMSIGLSSILDLYDKSINSQNPCLSSKQRKELYSSFSGLKMKTLPVDGLIKTTLTVILHFYSKDAKVSRSLKYVKSILDNNLTVSQFFCFTGQTFFFYS